MKVELKLLQMLRFKSELAHNITPNFLVLE